MQRSLPHETDDRAEARKKKQKMWQKKNVMHTGSARLYNYCEQCRTGVAAMHRSANYHARLFARRAARSVTRRMLTERDGDCAKPIHELSTLLRRRFDCAYYWDIRERARARARARDRNSRLRQAMLSYERAKDSPDEQLFLVVDPPGHHGGSCNFRKIMYITSDLFFFRF